MTDRVAVKHLWFSEHTVQCILKTAANAATVLRSLVPPVIRESSGFMEV